MTHRHKLTDPVAIRDFVFGGNATFTIVSKVSGARFTYRVRKCKNDETLFFVSVLNGADNESSYAYLGTMRKAAVTSYKHGRKSKIGETATSSKSVDWFTRHVLSAMTLPESVEFWHEGSCGRCGRKLTVPESIARGIGPECANLMGV